MKVSIALCTYNGSAFLDEQLASFSAQTRPPDEIVVCDDCSTDSTVEIVRRYAATAAFPVRLHVNETNLRSTVNFAKAIALCTGDVIFPADQDDVWLPEKLRLCEAEFLKDEAVGMVFCNGEVVDENLKSYNRTSWDLRGFKDERYKRFVKGKTFEVLREGNFVSGCMMAFRADLKELLLPIPTNLDEVIHDYWIALVLSLVSRVVALPPSPLVKYRQHSRQQLGLRPDDAAEIEETMIERTRRRTSFAEQLTRARAIETRLRAVENKFPCAEARRYLNQYIAHMEARTALQNKRAARLPTVLRELAARRYHRYSNGLKSAFKDLMF